MIVLANILILHDTSERWTTCYRWPFYGIGKHRCVSSWNILKIEISFTFCGQTPSSHKVVTQVLLFFISYTAIIQIKKKKKKQNDYDTILNSKCSYLCRFLLYNNSSNSYNIKIKIIKFTQMMFEVFYKLCASKYSYLSTIWFFFESRVLLVISNVFLRLSAPSQFVTREIEKCKRHTRMH